MTKQISEKRFVAYNEAKLFAAEIESRGGFAVFEKRTTEFGIVFLVSFWG